MTKRTIHITVEPHILAQMDERAKAAGISRSEYITRQIPPDNAAAPGPGSIGCGADIKIIGASFEFGSWSPIPTALMAMTTKDQIDALLARGSRPFDYRLDGERAHLTYVLESPAVATIPSREELTANMTAEEKRELDRHLERRGGGLGQISADQMEQVRINRRLRMEGHEDRARLEQLDAIAKRPGRDALGIGPVLWIGGIVAGALILGGLAEWSGLI